MHLFFLHSNFKNSHSTVCSAWIGTRAEHTVLCFAVFCCAVMSCAVLCCEKFWNCCVKFAVKKLHFTFETPNCDVLCIFCCVKIYTAVQYLLCCAVSQKSMNVQPWSERIGLLQKSNHIRQLATPWLWGGGGGSAKSNILAKILIF